MTSTQNESLLSPYYCVTLTDTPLLLLLLWLKQFGKIYDKGNTVFVFTIADTDSCDDTAGKVIVGRCVVAFFRPRIHHIMVMREQETTSK